MPLYNVTITDLVCPGAEVVTLSLPSGGRVTFTRTDGDSQKLDAELSMSEDDAAALLADGYEVSLIEEE